VKIKAYILGLVALIFTLGALAFGVSTAAAHGCHHYCAWIWLGDGGGAWCGEDHDGDIVYNIYGAGYRCNWYWTPGGHDAEWTSGY
jgi:hypothetical protein